MSGILPSTPAGPHSLRSRVQICSRQICQTSFYGSNPRRDDRIKKPPKGGFSIRWSGREDSNLRPLQPHCSALPDCATPRRFNQIVYRDRSYNRPQVVNNAVPEGAVLLKAKKCPRELILPRHAPTLKLILQRNARGASASLAGRGSVTQSSIPLKPSALEPAGSVPVPLEPGG